MRGESVRVLTITPRLDLINAFKTHFPEVDASVGIDDPFTYFRKEHFPEGYAYLGISNLPFLEGYAPRGMSKLPFLEGYAS